MKLGIMQPYFFPYLGYFSLIKNTDEWIVFDQVQFIRHGWIERNRILKPVNGWQYISVPLEKHPRETKIADIQIRTGEDWRSKIFRQIEHYKKAPHYVTVVELIREALNVDTKSIVELNVRVLQTICAYLSVHFNFSIYSRMSLEIEPVDHAGAWAVNISKALKAREYINPIGGMEIFNPAEFRRNGINLVFLRNTLPPYNQRRKQFEVGLSIIDVLMFNDVAQTNALIDSVEYIRN